MKGISHLTIWALLGLLSPILLCGCGIVDTDEPTQARLVLGGAAGHPLILISSDDFDILLDVDGQTRIVEIASADTVSS